MKKKEIDDEQCKRKVTLIHVEVMLILDVTHGKK